MISVDKHLFKVSNKDARGMPMDVALLPNFLTVRGCLGTGNGTFYESEFSCFEFCFRHCSDVFVFFQGQNMWKSSECGKILKFRDYPILCQCFHLFQRFSVFYRKLGEVL